MCSLRPNVIWRRHETTVREEALGRNPGGRAADPRDQKIARLEKEKARLSNELDKARKVIKVQGNTMGAVGAARHRQRASTPRRIHVGVTFLSRPRDVLRRRISPGSRASERDIPGSIFPCTHPVR